MSGPRDDGTSAPDNAHHEGRKVGFEHHIGRAGTPYARTYKYALSVLGENGPGSRRTIGLSDTLGDLYQRTAKVNRSLVFPGTSYEYTERPED